MRKKYLNRIKSIGILLLLCMGISVGRKNTAYAAPVSQERLLEQLSEAFAKGTVYEVIQDGTGDFTTISEAIEAATSQDTLLIYPGIYEEAIEVYDKEINLIGTDRDSCVIQYDSTQYHKIPLTFGAGYISNMTIYGYREDCEEEETALYSTNDSYNNMTVDSIKEWQKLFPGYAVHIDQDYSYGRDVLMENCKIISNNSQCVGIGSRGDSHISFRDCELISNGTGGCIYLHNTQNPDLAGDAYLTLKDCSLRNYKCPYIMSLHSMGELNPLYLTFQNVSVNTVAYERKGSYNSTNMNIWQDVDTRALTEGGIFYLDKEQSLEYLTKLRDKVSLKEEVPRLKEGITYIKMVEISKEYQEEEKLSQVKARVRHVVDIYNVSKEAGNGWCGLENIYLMPESYGNTLTEMNYIWQDETFAYDRMGQFSQKQ